MEEKQPPVLLEPIPDQSVRVGEPFRLDLNAYISDGEDRDDDAPYNTDLFFTVEIRETGHLPFNLHYTITGEIYGELSTLALPESPYTITVEVSNSGSEPLITTFQLEVLPPEKPEDEWSYDESLLKEFEGIGQLDPAEERALFDALQAQAEKEGRFTDEKSDIWQAILQDKTMEELKVLIDRPLSHQDLYYLLSRFSYFVIWNAENPEPAGPLELLALEGASEHFNVYNRGSCIVATPKHLFDYNRTLWHGIQTAKAMAREVFRQAWKVEFGGYDKMVRAAWVELELLSRKFSKQVTYAYFQPTPQDYDSLQKATGPMS